MNSIETSTNVLVADKNQLEIIFPKTQCSALLFEGIFLNLDLLEMEEFALEGIASDKMK